MGVQRGTQKIKKALQVNACKAFRVYPLVLSKCCLFVSGYDRLDFPGTPSRLWGNAHLHTILYPRNLRAFSGHKMPKLIWELFGAVAVFQIRQQSRHRRFERRQILLGEIPRPGQAAHAGTDGSGHRGNRRNRSR